MNEINGGTIDGQDIEAAIAKAVELRTLQAAALMQGIRPPPPPPPASHFSAHDYPVFTPSYVDDPLPGYAHLQTMSQTLSGSWEDNQIEDHDNILQPSNYIRADESSRRELPTGLVNIDPHIWPADDSRSVVSSCTSYLAVVQNSPGNEILKSRRRNSLGDFKSVSSCNNCKPATVSTDDDNGSIKLTINAVGPLTHSHASMNQSEPKSRGMILSWLLPRVKRRLKNGNSSPVRTESEEVSQVLKDFGTVPIEMLKKELTEANQKRNLALKEFSEMRSSFGELRKKLETLELYCEELKKALKQTVQANSISKEDNLMPVSEEVMIEEFLQIVSEARLSVKQFCKTLFKHIDETTEQQTESLNLLLKPYKLSLSSRYSKGVLYHLEAIISEAFYQDFENCVFQENGVPKLLDPHQNRQAEFQSFAALRNLSWIEVLKKGTENYSEEFSQFCDRKMNCVITKLNWPWSETLLQSFFVAAKCIWLLHLIAFSFYPPSTILRVEENRPFDPLYMEDIFSDKQNNPSRVKVMITPGFYVQDKILRCKVLCRYKSAA